MSLVKKIKNLFSHQDCIKDCMTYSSYLSEFYPHVKLSNRRFKIDCPDCDNSLNLKFFDVIGIESSIVNFRCDKCLTEVPIPIWYLKRCISQKWGSQ